MIDRYTPFSQMMSLRQLMDRLLEDAFVMPREDRETSPLSAPLNVYEEGDHLVVEAQLPGVKPEDIEVTLEGGMLTIHGEMKAEEERQDRNYVIREQRQGSFRRTLRLPESVDPDRVQTSFENGVLRLSFPRSERARPRRISIGAQSERGAQGQQAQIDSGQTGSGVKRQEQDRAGQPAAAGSRNDGGS